MKLNLTAQIESVHANRLTAFSNSCLAPLCYLFDGRRVTLYKGEMIHSRPAYSEKTWQKTALAIIALVPATILAILSRLIEQLYTNLRHDHNAVSREPVVVTDDMSLNKAYKIVYKKAEHLTDVSEYMKDAEKQMTILYRELRKKAAEKLAEMEKRLGPDVLRTIEQYKSINLHSWQERKEARKVLGDEAFTYYEMVQKCRGDKTKLVAIQMAHQLEQNYVQEYFYNTLTEVYHDIRIKADLKPFFEPGTAWYEWREAYNRFCAMFDEVREYIEDTRFSNWSKPDLEEVKWKEYPDSRPSVPSLITFYE